MAELSCDICGRTPVRAQILLEGAKLLACARCMKSGKIIHRFDEGEQAKEAPPPPSPMAASEEVVEDYAKRIREARQKAKIPIAVVAERISEKESYLHGIETSRLTPTIEVARKLEKELGITLIEKVEASSAPSAAAAKKKFSAPTLGDMLEGGK
ncbi:TIGR00270 family protein [Candidatus Micrarchaeota archaeon]|nr:TIGR00270 family protein [Candidatus Micrarchaeota archaeon]